MAASGKGYAQDDEEMRPLVGEGQGKVQGQADAKAVAPAAKSLLMFHLLAACVTWLAASCGIIIANRIVMVEYQFHYPIAVSAMGMAVSGLMCFIWCDVMKKVPPPDFPIDSKFLLSRVLPVGITQAITLCLGNALYLHLTVAFIEMGRALLPLFTMVALQVAGLETPNQPIVAAVLVTSLGCAISAYGEVKLDPVGLVLLLCNLVGESLRLVLTQSILTGFNMHPLQALKLMGTACATCLGIMSFFLERGAMAEQGAYAIVVEHWPVFALAASLGLAVNLLSTLVIKISSATTMKVLAAARSPMLVMAGVLVFQEHVSPLELLGYTITLIGFGYYNYAKWKQQVEATGRARA